MKKQMIIFGIAAALVLSGCGNGNGSNGEKVEENMGGMDHGSHSSSGEVPETLEAANNPLYPVGSQALMTSDHMAGMNGAEATIVGAYATTVYAVSYTPASGGERVTNHKWVIHEEIKNRSNDPYKPGAEVVLEADHMNGMKDAIAIIDTAEQTTVYMVDYVPTTGGEKVTNHKWVTESELKAKK
ncbi:YdhK family protein [Paenibacillus sp. GSMTC-2017]|uniref:YdhK family protein n=1 Tax=Paenibacillus sp. GSMTC-2017 TaxID=2794350 RepID=UPI0018D5CCD1|nr:YdhK family protein [Paenibacillus sp. GSMTC-2017]MBH5317096.1 YdhK family protein [Paenibacillus sp. GSMTC-2017]